MTTQISTLVHVTVSILRIAVVNNLALAFATQWLAEQTQASYEAHIQAKAAKYES